MHPKGFPYEGKLSPKATDEVDNAAKKQVPPTSSVTAPPCHLPLVGEGRGDYFRLRIAAMNSGVVPQQPPRRAAPLALRACMWRTKSSGPML